MRAVHFYLTFFILLTGCQYPFGMRDKNPVERAETQRFSADMIIVVDGQKNIYVEKPLLNVIDNAHHPYSLEEFIRILDKDYLEKKLIVVTLKDTWNSQDPLSRLKAMEELEILLKRYFSKIIFHQERRHFYTKILKE